MRPITKVSKWTTACSTPSTLAGGGGATVFHGLMPKGITMGGLALGDLALFWSLRIIDTNPGSAMATGAADEFLHIPW